MASVEHIEGNRIYLDCLDPDHLSKAYCSWMKDPQVLRFLARPSADYSVQALTSFVRTMNDSLNNYLFGIFLKEGQRHIGNVKIGNVDEQNGIADVGIIIGQKAFWGQGYATETLGLVIDYGFKRIGLFKLYAGMIENNEASRRAFLKAGFKVIGRYRGHWLVEGQRYDQYMMDILREGN